MGYRASRWRAVMLIALLFVSSALAVAVAVSTFAELKLLEKAGSGGITLAEAHANNERQHALAVAYVIAVVVTIIGWCVWQYRAQANVIALGAAGARFSPGWAVGWWFIPFANLVKPYQSVQELWKGSAPDHDGYGWSQKPGWPLIGFWWAAWLGAGSLERLNRSINGGASGDVGSAIDRDRLAIVAALAVVVAGVLATIIVMRIDARLARRSTSPPSASSPQRPDLPG